jgi:hypothetical protein
VVAGCKRRNISSGVVNSRRSSGQQWGIFCLGTDKREYPKSVTGLLRLEEKRFLQGMLLRKQHSYIYLKIDMYEKKTK